MCASSLFFGISKIGFDDKNWNILKQSRNVDYANESSSQRHDQNVICDELKDVWADAFFGFRLLSIFGGRLKGVNVNSSKATSLSNL